MRLFCRCALTLGFVTCAGSIFAQNAPLQTPAYQQQRIQQPASQPQTVQQVPIQAQRIQNQPIKQPPLTVVQNGNLVYQRDPAAQPAVPQQAYQNGFQTAAAPSGSIPIYGGNNTLNPSSPANNPVVVNPAGQNVPEQKIVPFLLTPGQQQELDEFLARWEKYSFNVKRYDVDFSMFIYDSTIPGQSLDKPYKVTYGYFKYIANPLRFVYHVEGEWQNNKQMKRDGDKNEGIYAEKVIIDEKTVYKYDYNAKTVIRLDVPAEMIGKGIADSPLPLIFGAKSEDLKKRFSMKLKDPANEERIWLEAIPLLLEDQQEFSSIEIMLDSKTLQAIGLKRYDINGKAYVVYDLRSPKVNARLSSVLDDLKTWFTPTVERGWKYEVRNWIARQPATQAPPVGNPIPQQQSQRNEIPLYRVE